MKKKEKNEEKKKKSKKRKKLLVVDNLANDFAELKIEAVVEEPEALVNMLVDLKVDDEKDMRFVDGS